MKKIIDELINNSIKGVDVYRYNNATWLIFTDENRWVVEMTDEGTLWYNYKFFNDIMKYVSMDPKEYEGYITQWANDYFFKGVKEFKGNRLYQDGYINHVVDNGVKKMGDSNSIRVQNRGQNLTWRIVKDVKPNVVFHGINDECMSYVPCGGNITDIWRIIEEGVKNVMPSKATSKSGIHFDDVMCSGNITDVSLIVEQGIKNTYPETDNEFVEADIIIKNGIKNTYPDRNSGDYDWSNEFEADKVIERGVKV